MLVFQVSPARLVLTAMLLISAMGSSACAQEKPKRMIPGPSMRELVPESQNEKEDGISRIVFAQLFKEGPTEYTHVGTGALKNAPPLPTGYTLYRDRVYEVKTQAIITASFNITVFNVPSLQHQNEFKKLAILHLKYDELSPADKSWEEITLLPEYAEEMVFRFIPKAKYDSLQPNFNSRLIAGISDYFGLFAITFAPDSEPERTQPFPEVVLKATSSPEPARPAQEVTHTLVFTNQGIGAAAEVNVREVLDADLDFISVRPTQGHCKQKRALNIVTCHLGPLAGKASATITIVTRARQEVFVSSPPSEKPARSRVVPNTLEVVFKQIATDFVDERGQIFADITTTIINERPPEP